MFKYNLIGYEDYYFCHFQRPKNMKNHQKKINEIQIRKNLFSSDSSNSLRSGNSKSKNTRKSNSNDSSKMKVFFI